ncbi:MAG: hypothetical protein F7C07_07520 [Desulfurococcales archaeon]|nr:hypothetical protein [Desulfurococcales archaeon]
MALQTYDPVVAAAKYATNLYEALKASGAQINNDKRIEARGLYSRARQFPSLLAQSGLIPVAAFSIAKTEDLMTIDEAFEVYAGLRIRSERLKKESSENGGGYAAMAGLIARVLIDLEVCKPEQGPVAVFLSKCLVDLSQNGKLLTTESIVLTVIQEFKKYIEAFVAKPEREE